MLVTSLSSIMLQVCSVIIISPMIRGSRLTAHVVIVSKATSALVSSGIVHRHLEWKLTARKRRLLAPRRRFSRNVVFFFREKRLIERITQRESTNQDWIHDDRDVRTQQESGLDSACFLRSARCERRLVEVSCLSLRRIGSWRKRLHGDAYVFPFFPLTLLSVPLIAPMLSIFFVDIQNKIIRALAKENWHCKRTKEKKCFLSYLEKF